MLVSYNLIKEIVDLPSTTTPSSLADMLTIRGIEVEEVYPLAEASNITVGKIISCEKHPSSDHLHLLKVDCGHHGVFDIVCGAPNARTGIKVIVALVGANLKSIGLVIKPSTIAGYQSQGMCCSLKELGVDESLLTDYQKSGIEELPIEFKEGDDEVLKLLGLDDFILNLNILANRPDLTSIIGIAKEISAIYGCSFKEVSLPDIKVTNKIKVKSSSNNCLAFGLLEVETSGEITSSPDKLKQYLVALGYRPISLAVDLGNFMMAITGQPFHFYDLNKVKALNNQIAFDVKDDFEGKVITLDEKEIEVKKGDLVVTDGITPMCLAGVMGLKNVATETGSKYFGIEAANFSYSQIRHTVKRTGLTSDSASRFIKKVNASLLNESLLLLAKVYQSIDPSFKVISYSLYDEEEKQDMSIPFSLERANNRLGGHFTKEQVNDIFKRLRFFWEGDKVIVPIDRKDIKEQADLEEEIFRYSDPLSLDNNLSKLPLSLGKRNEKQSLVKKIRDYLISSGLYEVLTYTLVDRRTDRSYRIFNEDIESIKIGNPMTEDHEFVRSDITSSLVKTINYNRSRQKDDFGIFEISEIHYDDKMRTYLSIALSGNINTQGLLKVRPYDFYDIKGYLEGIFKIIGLQQNRYKIVRASQDFFHKGRSADVYIGKDKVASLGQINPALEKQCTLICEIDLSLLLTIKTGPVKFSPISIYPDVERDFAFVVDNQVSSESLITTIKKTVGSTLKSVDVFDVYQIDENKKSLAIKCIFTSIDHTFKENELLELQDKIIKAVKEKIGGTLR